MLNQVSNQLDSAGNGHRHFHDWYPGAGYGLDRKMGIFAG